MEKYNFMDHKFRASSFGDLMAGGKGLTDKQIELIDSYEKKKTEKKTLTEKQQELYDKLTDQAEHTEKEIKIIEDLEKRMNEVVGLTEKQQETLDELLQKRDSVELSKGAKTYLRKLRREIKFGRRREINSKYLVKGIHYEEEAITFLSMYHDDVFTNNTERRYSEYFQGECDVEEGFDTKVSWSLDTLPDPEEALKTIYEFQNRVYMILWDKDQWTTSSIIMDMADDELKKVMYGEAWKWKNNEIPDYRKIEIIKYYIYNEENFIRLCKEHDCLPDLKEYEKQLKNESVDLELEKACKMFMDFREIPDYERIVEKTVYRDPEIEENMEEVAKLSRAYMQDIEDEMYEKYKNRELNP